MDTPRAYVFKLAAFVAGLLLLFGAGAIAGNLIDPDRTKPAAAHAESGGAGHAETEGAGHTETEGAGHGAAGAGAHAGEGADAVRGLAVAENGLRLVIEDAELRRGAEETVVVRVVDVEGATVRDLDVEHTRRMHVIVARRDLSGFQHLHPEQAADGSWRLPLTLATAGSHRLFADFTHAGEKTTLAADLRVDGAADLEPLPAPATSAVSDGGHDVRLAAGGAHPGEEAALRFDIARDGRAIRPQEYLGAGGHLVALREGDLAFLHVHPTGDGEAAFAATFPTAGRYRLFLQFKDAGRVHTAAFTLDVR